jgi:Tol biopolymer transport system component
MDFGLAKGMVPPGAASAELTATLTSSHATPLTQQGTIVGTFQYMSPEQVEGKDADARSDIFSLGAVLYEMLSGKRAFEGKTLVSVAASILEKDPEPIRNLQPLTPASLERVIKKCLAKDPDERWQSAGDLASELKWIAGGGATSDTQLAALPLRGRRVRVREWLAWMFCAMAIIAVIVLSLVLGFSGSEKPVVLTQIASSEKLQFNFLGDNGGPPVISPDGKKIVFSGRLDGKRQLFLRWLDKLAPEPIAGGEEATFPFWSPDGRSIAFFADGKLKKMDIAGGAALTICDAPVGRGGSWGTNGTIVFSPQFTESLFQVPATGGTPSRVTQLSDQFTTHRWPAFLPDGKHFLYLAANHGETSKANTAVFWVSLDGKDNKLLFESRSNAIYASGYLLYVRDTTLMAQPFDGSSGQLRGEPVALNGDVQVDGTVWRGTFAASDNGLLIYQPSTSGAGRRLTWFDRTGKEVAALPDADAYFQVELSPDDKKAAITVGEPVGVIWIYDLARGSRSRFTFGNRSYSNAIWSKDGKQIAYLSGDPGSVYNRDIVVKNADGSGEERKLLNLGAARSLQEGLDDWSPDGRYLMYDMGTLGQSNGMDIWVLPLAGDGKPFTYASGPGDQVLGQFSPDGKWVVYAANETGRMEIYVAPFPWTGSKWQVSSTGGMRARWRRDGKEIVFEIPGTGRVMMAEVNTRGSSFELGEVRTLFEGHNFSPSNVGSQWSLSSDGQRALNITTGATGVLPLTLIQNWTGELKKK